MSLQDIYHASYGEGATAGEEAEKTADENQVDEILAKFDEDECSKLAAAAELMDSFGMEFESGAEKIAAACNIIDHLSEDDGEDGSEKVAGEDDEEQAVELDAAGRIMARGFMDEINGAEKTASAGSFAERLYS